MADYELTAAADGDLLEIAIYTINTWGLKQADIYEASLVSCFEAIGRGDAQSRMVLENWPELCSSRCQHHYVFFLRRANACPRILAVFHEKMDLLARLRERLEQGLEP